MAAEQDLGRVRTDLDVDAAVTVCSTSWDDGAVGPPETRPPTRRASPADLDTALETAVSGFGVTA